MDEIIDFVDILTDNLLIVKRYKPELITSDDPRFDNFEFSEDLLISTDELHDEDLLTFLEHELRYNTTPISFVLNGHKQPVSLENHLETEFEKFRIVIINNYNSIDKSTLKEVVKKVKGSSNELELILSANKKNQIFILDKLIKVKIEFCSETIRFINNPIFIINNLGDKKPAKPKKPLEKLTDLTQNQVVILSHYLKELGYLGKEMTKLDYAKHISELTGFASEKIRQDLSHIGKKSNSLESGEFLEADYSVVRRSLDKLIAAIKKDSAEKFSL